MSPRRLGRALLFGFRARAARIHAPLFWRVVYGVLASRLGVRALALACRLGARLLPGAAPEDVATRLAHVFVSGWPHHPGTNWVNLNVQRAQQDVQRQLRRPAPRPLRAPRHRPERLRVGVLGNLSSTLGFHRAFFAGAPTDVDLFAFDLAGADAHVPYLAESIAGYQAFDRARMDLVADAIEAAELDVLLEDVYKADLHTLFDRISTPCIVDAGGTVQFTFHESVAFRYYSLAQADYVVRNARLVATASRTPVSRIPVYEGPFLFEERGLSEPPPRPWRERDPLIVFHGKLYKALTPAYIDTVFGLLAEDPELELVMLGRDADGALDSLRAAARRHGVESRFRYEGQFFVRRNEAGEIDDPSWLRVAELLRRARLAPDPWPLCGGYSRVEAYLAGVPVAHMGLRRDEASWGKPQLMLTAEQMDLEVERTSAYTVDEYAQLCRRLLTDEPFADSVAAEQRKLAEQLADPARFWGILLGAYEQWLATRAS